MQRSFLIKSLVLLLALVPALPPLSAYDLGLLLDQNGSYENTADTNELSYTGVLIPWFSTPLNDWGDLYIAAGATVEYGQEEWTMVPELLRTELEGRWDVIELRAGRIPYSDPLGFIASGLFDGARVTYDTPRGTWSLGAWYTGFLYKKNANITMTYDELGLYDSKVDYSDFANTYFAPRRFLAALDWEHPGLKELVRLKAALIGQFDLTGGEELYHSQYLTAKLSIPVQSFVLDLGACVETMEVSRNFQISFAGELGIAWYLPTSLDDRLMFTGRFSGGTVNDTVRAFVPLTTQPQGNILKAKLSGLSMLNLDYTARLQESFSFSLSSSYFVISDMRTYDGIPGGRDGYFLGNEFYGKLVWSPVSDLQIRAGGGVFLPMLGNADPQGGLLWQVELRVSLALF